MWGEVNSVKWAKNNSVFFAGSNNNRVAMYDSSGYYIKDLYTMPGNVMGIDISPDGDNLVVGSKNGGCRVINATSGLFLADLWNGTTSSDIYEVAWSDSDDRIYCGGFDSTLKSYYASNYSFDKNFPGLPGWISGIDTTPDGRIVFASGNQQVYGFWAENGTVYLNMTNHSGYVAIVKVSPDGRYLASGALDSSVIVTDIKSKAIIKQISIAGWVHGVHFSSDGGSMLVTRGYGDEFYVFRTDTWTSIGTMTGFGTTQNNRGVFSAEFNEDGDKIAVGWRRGWVSVQTISENFIRVQGLHYTSLMESPWKSTYTSTNDYFGFWEYDRLQSTLDACESKHHIGSSTNGVSPTLASKSANYSMTGIWECDTTDEEILEIPYGRAAGALMVKADGEAQSCVETIGGLSLAQIRWIASASGRSVDNNW